MKVREGFKNMSKGSSIDLNGKLRELKDKVPVSDIVEVEMVMGPDTVKENLAFTWKVDTFNTQDMLIHLDFEKPIFISARNERD